MTLRMMAKPGRIRGVGSVFGVLRNALPGEAGDSVGKIRLLVGQPEGDGTSFGTQCCVSCLFCRQLQVFGKKCDSRGLQCRSAA